MKGRVVKARMSSDFLNHRLQSVELDEESLAAASRDQEQERQIAIFDLLEDNHFARTAEAAVPTICGSP